MRDRIPVMLTRRSFSAVAAASAAMAYQQKIKLGVIGCGWWGGVDLDAAYRVGGVECTAICDVDQAHLDEFTAKIEKAQGSKPKVYRDYRELIENSGVDALLLTTPPHWHALPFLEACKKKLPVYCEKPFAYDVRENQAMVAAWKKAGNMVQVGFQRRQGDTYKAVKQFIAEGKAGKILQADPRIHFKAGTPDPKPVPVPKGFDWETWVGPAPFRPYSVAIGHRSWRLEQTTGHGHLVDWGIHLIDATRVMLGETTPRTVTASGGIFEYKGMITTPDTLSVWFDFARCPVSWNHRIWGAAEADPALNNGVFLYGTDATIFVTDGFYRVMPRDKKTEAFEKKATIQGNAMSDAHMKEFLEAVRGNGKPSCTPEDAALSTTTVQLAMAAYETTGKLEWNAAKWAVEGNAAAAKLLKREYRGPYKHPFNG